MAKSENNYKDNISELKEFRKYGDLFKQVEDFGDGIYLYSRENVGEGGHKGVYVYELVRGAIHLNADGSRVLSYPGSSLWGAYGKTIWLDTTREEIMKIVEEWRAKK